MVEWGEPVDSPTSRMSAAPAPAASSAPALAMMTRALLAELIAEVTRQEHDREASCDGACLGAPGARVAGSRAADHIPPPLSHLMATAMVGHRPPGGHRGTGSGEGVTFHLPLWLACCRGRPGTSPVEASPAALDSATTGSRRRGALGLHLLREVLRRRPSGLALTPGGAGRRTAIPRRRRGEHGIRPVRRCHRRAVPERQHRRGAVEA